MPRRSKSRRSKSRRSKSRRSKSRRSKSRRSKSRRSTRKRSTRKRSTRRLSEKRCNDCQRLLSVKIATNIKERRYASRAQAIAVAYSQVRKMQCSRCVGKKRGGNPTAKHNYNRNNSVEQNLTECLATPPRNEKLIQRYKTTAANPDPVRRGLSFFEIYDECARSVQFK